MNTTENKYDRFRRAGLTVAAIVVIGFLRPAAAMEPLEEFVIGIEDVLQVSMPDHPELGATVPVRPDGRISLPLIDDVIAAGLTPDQLKAHLTEAYRGYVTVPNISLMVVEIHSLKVYILGEVTNPGVFDLQRPIRILQAVALAGVTLLSLNRSRFPTFAKKLSCSWWNQRQKNFGERN